MKRVLVLGCSFTFGSELNNNNLAWPFLLGKSNSWEITNLAWPGASNDRNIRLLFDNVANNYDLVIFAWTVPDRFETVFMDQPLDVSVNTGRVRNIKWIDDYYKYSNDRLYNYGKWFRNVLMLQSYLKSIEQEYLFVSTFGMWSDLREELYQEYYPKLEHLIKQVDETHYVDWPKWGMIDWQGDCAKGPGGHPLELGHQRIAERINEHIRNIGWLS